MAGVDSEEEFPWGEGVFDAHCHPTDTMSSIPAILSMKTRVMTVMATRSQDQDLVSSVADQHCVKTSDFKSWSDEERIIPCFGWHPWFSHQMYISNDDSKIQGKLQGDDKLRHYQSVLQPHREDPSEEDKRVFLSLPDPTPFSLFLVNMRSHLEKYPYALVGEIGLDRSFRIPDAWIPELEGQRNEELTPGGREGRRLSPFRVDLKHQKQIVKLQLQLAAELGRAVSMHGVQAHGMVFDALKEMYEGHEKKVLSKREQKKRGQDHPNAQDGDNSREHDNKGQTGPKPYPPRICLHSYSGNPSNFKQYLNPSIPVEIFASFSTAINLSDSLDEETPKSFEEMVKNVPDHMLLVESDLHTAGEQMDRRIEDIVRRICKIKKWSLKDGVLRLGRNWRRFIFGSESLAG